jgi:hypothetical protein
VAPASDIEKTSVTAFMTAVPVLLPLLLLPPLLLPLLLLLPPSLLPQSMQCRRFVNERLQCRRRPALSLPPRTQNLDDRVACDVDRDVVRRRLDQR